MANFCKCCNAKIGFFSEYYYLTDDITLCEKCSGYVGHYLNQLYTVNTKATFDSLKAKIFEITEEKFSADIKKAIIEKVDHIEDSRTIFEDITEEELNNLKANKISVSSENNTEKSEERNPSKQNLSQEFNIDKFYNNIGGKIKLLAKIIAIIGAIGSIISGFALMTTADYLVVAGFMTLIFGPLACWVSSWTLYAFGQLVENSDKMVRSAEERNKENNE